MNLAPQTFALIGHPVGHSLSPAIHAAVYEQFQLPHRYLTVDCPDALAVRRQFERLKSGELAGANVTVPWKRLALDLADELDAEARAIGAANVLSRDAEGRITASNTDAAALAERLTLGSRGALNTATVIGNGGAALAAVVAARAAGASTVYVTARSWTASGGDWRDVDEFSRLGARAVEWIETSGSVPPDADGTSAQACARSQVIIQASSAGMRGVPDPESVCRAVPWRELLPGTFLYDVVYNPERTPFLQAAERHQLPFEGGLSMLIGQAALAAKKWLGIEPDQERMRSAATLALAGTAKLGAAGALGTVSSRSPKSDA